MYEYESKLIARHKRIVRRVFISWSVVAVVAMFLLLSIWTNAQSDLSLQFALTGLTIMGGAGFGALSQGIITDVT